MPDTLSAPLAPKYVAYGIVGGVAYCIAATIMLETLLELLFPTVNGAARLSYGQEFGMFSLPGCGVLGAVNGWAIAFRSRHCPILSPLLLGTMAIVGGVILLTLWNMQTASYGQDRSHVIVYSPPLTLCGITACVAMALGIRSLIESWDNRPRS